MINIYLIEPALRRPCPVIQRICEDLSAKLGSQNKSRPATSDSRFGRGAFLQVYIPVNP